jgi:hypothetical protein
MVARVIDALSDRLADRVAKRVVSQLYFRELHPSTLLQREAQAEAAAYVKEKMPGARRRAPCSRRPPAGSAKAR